MARAQERLDPGHERLWREALWRLGRRMAMLGDHDVLARVDVHTELDHGARGLRLVTGNLG
jgi:hypothetical protein